MRDSAISPAALRRLRHMWRSAGWPYQDKLEAELVDGGWLERRWDSEQRLTLHLSSQGIRALAASLRGNRQRLEAHNRLVERMARQLHQEGRIVWCGLPLRVGLPSPHDERLEWMMAIPDVFSIRHTTRADHLEPVAHEIKVRRADLLSDLRKPSKGPAYLEAAGQCWYVIRDGIGEPDEIPPEFGVVMARADDTLAVARRAPRHHHSLPFATWMSLAKASPQVFEPEGTDALGPTTDASPPLTPA